MNDIKESLFQTLNEVVEKQGIRVINISISGASNSPNIQIIICLLYTSDAADE